MKVDAHALWEAVKNVSIFSKAKSWAAGVQFHHRYDGTLRLRTSDDFVGIESRVHLDPEDLFRDLYLSHESIKELEKFLRGQKGELNFSIDMHEQLSVRSSGDELSLVMIPPASPDWWEMFEFVMDGIDLPASQVSPWALDPARLSKFTLLEPKAQFPLAIKNVHLLGGDHYVAFRFGPNTTGMIKPLDREKLEDVYEDTEDVLW